MVPRLGDGGLRVVGGTQGYMYEMSDLPGRDGLRGACKEGESLSPCCVMRAMWKSVRGIVVDEVEYLYCQCLRT